MRTISILGSTGSIGTQTLEVVEILGNIKVAGISGNHNIDLLERQARAFRPRLIAVMDAENAERLQRRLSDMPCQVLAGMDGLLAVATMERPLLAMLGCVLHLQQLPPEKTLHLPTKKHWFPPVSWSWI